MRGSVPMATPYSHGPFSRPRLLAMLTHARRSTTEAVLDAGTYRITVTNADRTSGSRAAALVVQRPSPCSLHMLRNGLVLIRN